MSKRAHRWALFYASGQQACPCGVKRRLIGASRSYEYKTPGGAWSTERPECTRKERAESNENESNERNGTMSNETETDKSKEPKFENVGILYVEGGSKAAHITLPKGMTPKTARAWLEKIETEQNREIKFLHRFGGWYPFDAMWAVYRALVEVYGFAHVADFEIQTMFGKMKEPPISISIEVAYGEKQQIPWGPIEVSGLSGPLTPQIALDKGLPCLQLIGTIKNSERARADDVIARAEHILKTRSIYRGKGVEIDFTIFQPGHVQFDVTRAPKFMDTRIAESELILSDHVADLLETSLWTPVRHAELCREHGIPLRRGILLAGKYGVGKTLAARVTAMLCERHGWTFLYIRDLAQLPQALFFAKRYEPAVIFAEDVNRVVSGSRDSEMDVLFNVVDGVDRKNDEVMIVFTTNDVDDIHAGMMRPGRIDTVITVEPPDAKAATRLIAHYGRKLIEPGTDLSEVGDMLAGQIPAIIREAVERSKLAAIKDAKPGEALSVRADHLATAARQMLEHAKYLEEAPEPKPDLAVLGEAIGNMIAAGMFQVGTDAAIDAVGNEGDGYPGTPGAEGMTRKILKRTPAALLDKAGRPNGQAD